MLNQFTFRIKRRFNRRFRLMTAIVSMIAIIGVLLFCLPAIVPRYVLTLGGRFSVLTPKGFSLGQQYDFNDPDGSAPVSSGMNELMLPRPDNRTILFKYPQVVKLGRPAYLSSEITQSVDFTVKEPPANGLIQIWALTTSLEDFLETSKNFSSIDYLSFESKKEKKGTLPCTLWDYTFKSNGKIIRGLEAFFDDKPYMYRISIFLGDAGDYSEKFQALFDEMVQSVTVR